MNPPPITRQMKTPRNEPIQTCFLSFLYRDRSFVPIDCFKNDNRTEMTITASKHSLKTTKKTATLKTLLVEPMINDQLTLSK